MNNFTEFVCVDCYFYWIYCPVNHILKYSIEPKKYSVPENEYKKTFIKTFMKRSSTSYKNLNDINEDVTYAESEYWFLYYLFSYVHGYVISICYLFYFRDCEDLYNHVHI